MGFSYHGPLQAGDPLYQGRQKETGDLTGALRVAHRSGKVESYYIVYGSRQSGKTSLLLHLQSLFKMPGCYPCWVNFQQTAGASSEQVLLFLARKIVSSVDELGTILKPPDKFEFDGFEFDTWLAKLPFDGHLVLLLEELGTLSQNSRQRLGGLLRGMFNSRFDSGKERLSRVMVVFFGGVEMLDMTCKESSPLYNVCKKIDLPDLDLNETTNLFKAGFTESGLDISTLNFGSLAKAIYTQVAGHPYLTQRMGDIALNYMRKGGKLPSARKIHNMAVELVKEDNTSHHSYFGHLYDTITQYGLVNACNHLLNSEPDKDIERLQLLGIAKKQQHQWVTRNPLIELQLRAWLPTIRAVHPSNTTSIEPEAILSRRQDEKELLDVIIPLMCLSTSTKRTSVMMQAGLGSLVPKMDLSGSAEVAISGLFQFLDQYGRLDNGQHTLGLFLSKLQNHVGLEMKQLIKAFIDKYGLMDSETGSTEPGRPVFVSYTWGGVSERTVDDHVYDYTHTEWHSPKSPEMTTENFEKFRARMNFKPNILLMTATKMELLQVLRLLKPLPPMKRIRHITKEKQTYYLGKFAALPAVVVRCEMGAVGRDAALNTARDAIEQWRPNALIMVGIAFGADRGKHQPADVLIAEKIVPYESQRVGQEIIFRSAIPSSGLTLLNRFKNALGWSFQRPDGSHVLAYSGAILSGEKLIDDPLVKQELMRQFSEAIGGEMEGAGVYAAASHAKLEWILVKGVCDWADGEKHDGYQEMAAAAAASLTHFVLSNPNALDGL